MNCARRRNAAGGASPIKCKSAAGATAAAAAAASAKYPPTAYSTTSYQTVCPQNSMVSIAKLPKHGRKYPPAHVYRKSTRTSYKTSSQSISLTGNETVL